MFIASQHQYVGAPAERHVALAFRLHAAPTERDRLGIWGYKHVAPPEQEPSTTRPHDHNQNSFI